MKTIAVVNNEQALAELGRVRCRRPDGFLGLTGINDGRGGHKSALKLFDKALRE